MKEKTKDWLYPWLTMCVGVPAFFGFLYWGRTHQTAAAIIGLGLLVAFFAVALKTITKSVIGPHEPPGDF